MENILVAITNLPAVYPIVTAYKRNDTITTFCLAFVSTASFVSHLFESHKHDMNGFGCPKQWSYILNRFDVIGVVLIVLRMFYLHVTKYSLCLPPKMYWLAFRVFIASIFNIVSEHGTKHKRIYMALHSIWHVSIFLLTNEYLEEY